LDLLAQFGRIKPLIKKDHRGEIINAPSAREQRRAKSGHYYNQVTKKIEPIEPLDEIE